MWAWKNDYNKIIFFNEAITLLSESLKLLNLNLVNIQVTGWLYRKTLVRVDISRPFVSLSLFFGGGAKSILFYLFWNNKASSKYIYTLIGVHIWVFFNTESLNELAPHLNNHWIYNAFDWISRNIIFSFCFADLQDNCMVQTLSLCNQTGVLMFNRPCIFNGPS